VKNFQIIILIVFIIAAILGVLVFSGMIPLGDQSQKDGSGGTVVLWGTQKAIDLAEAVDNFNRLNRTYTLQYVEKRADTFDQELLEALASGTGPDLFLISNDLVYKYSNKILTIPYQSYPISTFRQNFLSAGEIFLTTQGFWAFPVVVDPLVLYYNRSLLDTNNIIYPPKTWEEMVEMVPILTQKDETQKILKSAVALGQFSNILHAKDILSTLFLQAGNPIIIEKNGSFISVLEQKVGQYNVDQFLDFYTSFTNPLKEVYSWNKSLPEAKESFSAENLAFYFGFASELRSLIEKNPNQNFMVAEFPQIKDSFTKITGARVIGLAISSTSKNLNSAFLVANLLASGNFTKEFSAKFGAVPARRDLLSSSPEDTYQPIFYTSALFAKSWLYPEPKDSAEIFQKMIEGVLANTFSPTQAIREASNRLNISLK